MSIFKKTKASYHASRLFAYCRNCGESTSHEYIGNKKRPPFHHPSETPPQNLDGTYPVYACSICRCERHIPVS